MNETVAIEFGFAAAELGYRAYKENWDGVTVADKFIELGLKFFPRESLASSLTRAGVIAGEAAADALEDAKFGPKTG
jgi:hypothetical protein